MFPSAEVAQAVPAHPQRFQIFFHLQDDAIALQVESEVCTSMCPLKIFGLEIVPPCDERPGRLRLDLGRDPEGICLMAFGPCKGNFSLSRDFFVSGTYDIWINGAPAGSINL